MNHSQCKPPIRCQAWYFHGVLIFLLVVIQTETFISWPLWLRSFSQLRYEFLLDSVQLKPEWRLELHEKLMRTSRQKLGRSLGGLMLILGILSEFPFCWLMFFLSFWKQVISWDRGFVDIKPGSILGIEIENREHGTMHVATWFGVLCKWMEMGFIYDGNFNGDNDDKPLDAKGYVPYLQTNPWLANEVVWATCDIYFRGGCLMPKQITIIITIVFKATTYHEVEGYYNLTYKVTIHFEHIHYY